MVLVHVHCFGSCFSRIFIQARSLQEQTGPLLRGCFVQGGFRTSHGGRRAPDNMY